MRNCSTIFQVGSLGDSLNVFAYRLFLCRISHSKVLLFSGCAVRLLRFVSCTVISIRIKMFSQILSELNVNVESSFDVSDALPHTFGLVEESRLQYEGKRIDNCVCVMISNDVSIFRSRDRTYGKTQRNARLWRATVCFGKWTHQTQVGVGFTSRDPSKDR